MKCHQKRESLYALFFPNRMIIEMEILINLLILIEFVINHFYLHRRYEMHWDIIQHHKKRSHLIDIHINDMAYFRIFVMEYLIYQLVYNKVHHRIKLQEQQVHKQHESNWILMLAKRDLNDLLLDILHKSIPKRKDFSSNPIIFSYWIINTC